MPAGGQADQAADKNVTLQVRLLRSLQRLSITTHYKAATVGRARGKMHAVFRITQRDQRSRLYMSDVATPRYNSDHHQFNGIGLYPADFRIFSMKILKKGVS